MLLQAAAGYGGPVTGQILYTTPGDGTFTFIVPTGVTSISVVCVSPGGASTWDQGGNGGPLAYANDVPVTPGQTFTVQLQYAYQARLTNNTTTLPVVYARQDTGNPVGGSHLSGYGYGGAKGQGDTGYADRGGAGGAGGYTGNGGRGGYYAAGNSAFWNGASGSGGGGGGGSLGRPYYRFSQYVEGGTGGGGGVGVLGQGANGSGGVYTGNFDGGSGGGGGGSGGSDGGSNYSIPIYTCCDPNPIAMESWGGAGGTYGGGGGGSNSYFGAGAVRIIWPGNTRTFPNTNTGNL